MRLLDINESRLGIVYNSDISCSIRFVTGFSLESGYDDHIDEDLSELGVDSIDEWQEIVSQELKMLTKFQYVRGTVANRFCTLIISLNEHQVVFFEDILTDLGFKKVSINNNPNTGNMCTTYILNKETGDETTAEIVQGRAPTYPSTRTTEVHHVRPY